MRSRTGVIAALLALTAALSIVAAAYASPNNAAAPTSKAVKCGTTRTIPFLTPVTGPAASLGGQRRRGHSRRAVGKSLRRLARQAA